MEISRCRGHPGNIPRPVLSPHQPRLYRCDAGGARGCTTSGCAARVSQQFVEQRGILGAERVGERDGRGHLDHFPASRRGLTWIIPLCVVFAVRMTASVVYRDQCSPDAGSVRSLAVSVRVMLSRAHVRGFAIKREIADCDVCFCCAASLMLPASMVTAGTCRSGDFRLRVVRSVFPSFPQINRMIAPFINRHSPDSEPIWSSCRRHRAHLIEIAKVATRRAVLCRTSDVLRLGGP